MKVTTEQIEKLAQLVSEILFEVVGSAEVNIAKIEDMTRYGLKEAGRRGFGKFLS